MYTVKGILLTVLFIELLIFKMCFGLPGGSNDKEFAYNEGIPGSIPGLGRSSGKGNGSPLQYSCLENPIYRGARVGWVEGLQSVGSQRVGHD